MDASFWIILWIIFLVAQNLLDKKKSQPPSQNDSINSPDFEIPTLANDPNFPGEENQIFIQDSAPTAEVREINLQDYYNNKKNFAENKIEREEIKNSEVEQKKLPFGLNPDTAMNAIIMSEILNKPKSMRRK